MRTLKKRELPSNILRYVLLLLGGAVSVMPMRCSMSRLISTG